MCSKVADKGIMSKVLFESLIEFGLKCDISLQKFLEGILAEGEGLGLMGEEIGPELFEDGPDN